MNPQAPRGAARTARQISNGFAPHSFLRALGILCALLATAPPAGAHRVDEYLQATRLSVDTGRVDLEIDLTPGVAMASKVFAWIDTDGDGEISSAEGEAYGREMLRSVALKIDGRLAPVTLVESSFPQIQDMSLGVGTIRLRAAAEVPVMAAGRHQLVFLNTHRPEASVYLVNALVPENPRIQLGDQRRDVAQHGLTLDYAVASEAPSPWARTLTLLAGLAMAGWLFVRFGRALAQTAVNCSTDS
jgi:hypothetical protein